ncbi:MAG: hypothetical protein H6622_00455 [Halobacteriovoraceae bacterium]|nr:hypothetical protein [Halobacteriovoraceae bacterium]
MKKLELTFLLFISISDSFGFWAKWFEEVQEQCMSENNAIICDGELYQKILKNISNSEDTDKIFLNWHRFEEINKIAKKISEDTKKAKIKYTSDKEKLLKNGPTNSDVKFVEQLATLQNQINILEENLLDCNISKMGKFEKELELIQENEKKCKEINDEYYENNIMPLVKTQSLLLSKRPLFAQENLRKYIEEIVKSKQGNIDKISDIKNEFNKYYGITQSVPRMDLGHCETKQELDHQVLMKLYKNKMQYKDPELTLSLGERKKDLILSNKQSLTLRNFIELEFQTELLSKTIVDCSDIPSITNDIDEINPTQIENSCSKKDREFYLRKIIPLQKRRMDLLKNNTFLSSDLSRRIITDTMNLNRERIKDIDILREKYIQQKNNSTMKSRISQESCSTKERLEKSVKDAIEDQTFKIDKDELMSKMKKDITSAISDLGKAERKYQNISEDYERTTKENPINFQMVTTGKWIHRYSYSDKDGKSLFREKITLDKYLKNILDDTLTTTELITYAKGEDISKEIMCEITKNKELNEKNDIYSMLSMDAATMLIPGLAWTAGLKFVRGTALLLRLNKIKNAEQVKNAAKPIFTLGALNAEAGSATLAWNEISRLESICESYNTASLTGVSIDREKYRECVETHDDQYLDYTMALTLGVVSVSGAIADVTRKFNHLPLPKKEKFKEEEIARYDETQREIITNLEEDIDRSSNKIIRQYDDLLKNRKMSDLDLKYFVGLIDLLGKRQSKMLPNGKKVNPKNIKNYMKEILEKCEIKK